ncbi:hypothetical protein BH24CHL6_BH24CHL6_04010 [soil metagenome]
MTDLLRRRPAAALLSAGIVGLSLMTAYVHFSLGTTASLMGLLFLANAAGYVALATAFVIGAAVRVPVVSRFSWLPRVALAGFTGLTIAGYLAMGPYFTLGWITKGIELGILALLLLDVIRVYGSPVALVRSAVASLRGRPDRAPATA